LSRAQTSLRSKDLSYSRLRLCRPLWILKAPPIFNNLLWFSGEPDLSDESRFDPQFQGLARLPYRVEAMCKFMCDLLEYGKQLADESKALK